jgi:hypothetical protein
VERANDQLIIGAEGFVTANIDQHWRGRGPEALIKLAWRNGKNDSLHAQPPRQVECRAELGRAIRLTGSLRFPRKHKANRLAGRAQARHDRRHEKWVGTRRLTAEQQPT